MNADRDNSEQPATHPCDGCGTQTAERVCRDCWGTNDDPMWCRDCNGVCKQLPTCSPMRQDRNAQRPSPGPEAPDATTDTPEAATQAQGGDERVRRYAEAIAPHAGLSRAAQEDAAHAVTAVADAEQAELRAEVEVLRGRYADARAALLNMDRLLTEVNGDADRAEAAERALAVERAKVVNLEAERDLLRGEAGTTEAIVQRVEALADKWESECDANEDEHRHGPAIARAVRACARDLRAALPHAPCCTSCEGTGFAGEGMCWDCRGTGHPHALGEPEVGD